MAKSVPLALIFFFLLCVWVVSFATKGSHLDSIYDNISAYRDRFDEIYPALEGCVAMDCILFFFELIGMILALRPRFKTSKIIATFILLSILARLIVGIIFLAGNSEAGRHIVDNYYELSSDRRPDLPSSTKTFVGAWLYEIIALCLGVPLSIIGAMLLVLQKE